MSEEQRTPQQRKAIEVYCDLLSDAFNDQGLDVEHVLTFKAISVPWSQELVKELLFKEVVRAMYNKESTTELTPKEVNEVYKVLDKFTAEKMEIHVEFPSIESQSMGALGVKK